MIKLPDNSTIVEETTETHLEKVFKSKGFYDNWDKQITFLGNCDRCKNYLRLYYRIYKSQDVCENCLIHLVNSEECECKEHFLQRFAKQLNLPDPNGIARKQQIIIFTLEEEFDIKMTSQKYEINISDFITKHQIKFIHGITFDQNIGGPYEIVDNYLYIIFPDKNVCYREYKGEKMSHELHRNGKRYVQATPKMQSLFSMINFDNKMDFQNIDTPLYLTFDKPQSFTSTTIKIKFEIYDIVVSEYDENNKLKYQRSILY